MTKEHTKFGGSLRITIMTNDETIIIPVLTEYSPDANGRYGLLTWNNNITKISGGREEKEVMALTNKSPVINLVDHKIVKPCPCTPPQLLIYPLRQGREKQ